MALSHSLDQLQKDLSTLGIGEGDTILMHSSFRSLGGVEGGAKGFFAAFQELLGSQGTLILPALSYASVTREQPEFDRQQTPVCVGYLPEFFRTRVPGVVRSFHPTHSCCARGARAEEMTADHELDLTPVGPHSPFARLPRVEGKILLLGCSTNANTSMHGVEETAEPPYLFNRSAPFHYILRDGDRVLEQWAMRHNFNDGVHFYRQCYSRIMGLLTPEELTTGKILNADAWVISAPALWEKGHRKLTEDPYYFVQEYLPEK